MAVSLPSIISEIAKASKKEDKKKVLLKHGQNGALREILKYAFHPDIKFLLPPGNPPFKSITDSTPNPTYLYGLVRKLYLFVEGGNPNLKQVRREDCYSITSSGGVVKDKKIKCRGLTYNLVKETFPELLP